MTIRLLRTLVAVADARTFSAAAEQVNVTHAAVSQQMQTLEADLGVSLFNRSTRTPELTPLAHQVVAKARNLIADYDNLVPSIIADGGLNDVIALGAMPTTLTGLAPRALRNLKQAFPGIGLHIRPGLSRALLADIERGTLDAAIVSKPHLLPPGVVFRTLSEEPMHLIASLQETGDDPIQLLKTRPFIRFNRQAVVGAMVDTWLQGKRIRVREAMELDSLESIASMVHANLGISIVPDLAVKPQETAPVKHIPLGPDAPLREIGLAWNQNQIKMRAIEALFDALLSVTHPASANQGVPSS